MSRPSVHVAGPIPQTVAAALAERFALQPTATGADGVLSLITTRVDDAYLAAAGPQLRVVANYGVGVNNIDVDAARARNVVVTNTPDVLTTATAEFTVALMLSLLRRVTEGDRLIRRGAAWKFGLEFMLGEGLDGRTVGIIGGGRIGSETARLVTAFGARAIVVRRNDSLDELLARSDVVSLHCPLTPETYHLIDAAVLRRMRSSAVLVNTSRGPVVDERALVDALRHGEIAGAALDVHEFEPQVDAALLELENVVLTPHLGSATRRARVAMGMLAVHALEDVLLKHRVPANAVE